MDYLAKQPGSSKLQISIFLSQVIEYTADAFKQKSIEHRRSYGPPPREILEKGRRTSQFYNSGK
ncbi:hypothetical protein EYZ11_000883 [Aspergillus tanneri]|uniref:Uncharacterized protein n=1 Tax=Aspergillus tanneri TaxID=1220188 RepID=A0A4S3JVZ2_9EURO|nr:hypothetical protein EYZ11_000883 [Aspergillus tanneri]